MSEETRLALGLGLLAVAALVADVAGCALGVWSSPLCTVAGLR